MKSLTMNMILLLQRTGVVFVTDLKVTRSPGSTCHASCILYFDHQDESICHVVVKSTFIELLGLKSVRV